MGVSSSQHKPDKISLDVRPLFQKLDVLMTHKKKTLHVRKSLHECFLPMVSQSVYNLDMLVRPSAYRLVYVLPGNSPYLPVRAMLTISCK